MRVDRQKRRWVATGVVVGALLGSVTSGASAAAAPRDRAGAQALPAAVEDVTIPTESPSAGEPAVPVSEGAEVLPAPLDEEPGASPLPSAESPEPAAPVVEPEAEAGPSPSGTGAEAAAVAVEAVEPVEPVDPPCSIPRPATSGRLTLNPAQAPPGGQVLAVITGLARYPEQIVGAGSGEFFNICLPAPSFSMVSPIVTNVGGTLVVPLTVPTNAYLGRNAVTVVFSEGSAGFSAPDADRVGLIGELEVVPGVPAARALPADTPPCGLAAAPPPAGVLSVTPRRVSPGGTVSVRLDDPPARLLPPTEFAGYYVVCLSGRAVLSPAPPPREGPEVPAPLPLRLDVAVPAGTPPGPQVIRVLAVTPGESAATWVGWTQRVTVLAEPPAAPRIPVGGVDAGGGALADTGTGASRSAPWVGAGLVAIAALVLVIVRRRRLAHS